MNTSNESLYMFKKKGKKEKEKNEPFRESFSLYTRLSPLINKTWEFKNSFYVWCVSYYLAQASKAMFLCNELD
jgi:hypothetical protein